MLLLLPALLLLALGGCSAKLGPGTIPRDRFDYSGAIVRSWKEQMLLNMVRVRYMDPPVFLDVQQVVQQYTLEGTGAISAPGWTGDTTIAPAAAVAGRWAESPTITYLPLNGDKFSKGLLQPVPPVTLFSLVQAGWPIDAVFDVGVRAINGLHAESKTVLFRRTADPRFYQVLSLLRELQASDAFGLRVGEKKDGAAGIVVFRTRPVDEAEAATVRKVREMLRLNPDAKEFGLALGAEPENDTEIAMLTRSMVEILAEASAGVEIPAADVEEGRVVKMEIPGGAREVGNRFIIHVHSSSNKPEQGDAFTAVHYRNHWFWVDDRDVPSKRGLGFLMVLFTLAESGSTVAPPALTISKP